MIAIISQEEASIKKTKSHSVQFTATSSGTKLVKKGFKGKSRPESGTQGNHQWLWSLRRSTSRGIVAIVRNLGTS